MHRRIGVVLLAALACVSMAACGSSSGGDSSSSSAAAGSTSGSASSDSGRFPASTYDPAVFGDLSGTVSWYDTDGGSFQRAQLDTIYKDYKDLTGVSVVPDYGDGTSTKFFAAQEQGGSIPWSFIEFYAVEDGHRAAKAGYLEKLDTSVVPVKNMEPGTYDEYGAQRAVFAQILAWNTNKYPSSGPHPTSASDFFDTKKFPGKRCAPQYGDNGLLEQALVADGVAPDKLYPLDVDRAFKKLDTIKDDIVFNLSPDSQIQSLVSGECDLAFAFSGRVFNAAVTEKAPIDETWIGAFYAPGYMAVPKGAPNPKAGQALIAMYLLDQEANKALVSKIPYPVPLTTIPLDQYPEIAQPWLPLGANVAEAIKKNIAYYDEHGPEINKRFTAWLAG